MNSDRQTMVGDDNKIINVSENDGVEWRRKVRVNNCATLFSPVRGVTLVCHTHTNTQRARSCFETTIVVKNDDFEYSNLPTKPLNKFQITHLRYQQEINSHPT